jgi:transposase
MRRRLARRSQLVEARTRVKNEIHAILIRRLKGRPDVSDLFGKAGRSWLGELELPIEERETLDSGLRQIDFLDGEIAAVDRVIAHDALNWPEARRLMSIPGVNLIASVTFLAAIGNIERFPDRRKLVGYLGLDPKVRQSGDAPAAYGHISKQGSSAARRALVEASWSAVRQPGPLHAFYQRIRARRGYVSHSRPPPRSHKVSDDGILLKDLVAAAQQRSGAHPLFPGGRLRNYVTYTKVDLEARCEIERLPRSTPQRVVRWRP